MQRPGTMPTALQNHRWVYIKKCLGAIYPSVPLKSDFFPILFRRPVPYYLQPDIKIHEFNKRLQHRTDVSIVAWKVYLKLSDFEVL